MWTTWIHLHNLWLGCMDIFYDNVYAKVIFGSQLFLSRSLIHFHGKEHPWEDLERQDGSTWQKCNWSFKTKPPHHCHLLEHATRSLRKGYGKAIEYLEYFMLSCSTLRFLLRNSADAQLWRPSVVQCSKRAARHVIISQQSKYERQNNRGSPASLHTGKLWQEEHVPYAWAERFGHSTLPGVNRGGADAYKSSIPFFHFTHHFLEPWALS